MSKEQKFYICNICGNLITKIEDSGVEVVCCGEPMTLLVANTVDASKEKHVPVVTVKDNIVTAEVGAVPHPMTDVHYIQWIYILTDKGGQLKYLQPEQAPKAEFALKDDKLIAVYEYCNIHGLWKTEA